MQNAVATNAADIQSAVCSRVLELTAIANQHFIGEPSIACPTVTFRASGTRAGTAFLQQHRINFHRVLLQHYPNEYLNEIVPHEMAHLVVYYYFGSCKPHGKEWQAVMRDLFLCEPKVTHQLDVAVLQRPNWEYYCGCAVHQLSTRRHNAVKRGLRQYRCKQCGIELKPR